MFDLPIDAIKLIQTFVENKRNEWSDRYPNRILREDVFSILDEMENCIVVYYPIEDRDNNGFHYTGIPDSTGKELHFVYINTHQTIEKQVFTAAHELGHVLCIDDRIIQQLGLNDSEESREGIINRFAAELMIPEESFRAKLKSLLVLEKQGKVGQDNVQITASRLIRVIVSLMDHFLVPYKSIIYRFKELGYFRDEISVKLMLGEGGISADSIEKAREEAVRDSGFVRFQKPTERKWIDKLPELLDIVEKRRLLPDQKIDGLRKAFDLLPPSEDQQTEKTVILNKSEG